MLKKFKRGKQIELVKNKNWWGAKSEFLKPIYNFEKNKNESF